MKFNKYVRNPYVVEAIQITESNIDELNKLIGFGEVCEEEDGRAYILVDKRLVPHINKAYVGWWVTKIENKFHCYAENVFENQFVEYGDRVSFSFDENGRVDKVLVSGAVNAGS